MFLQIPSYLPQNRHLHCIISPRSHNIKTLEKLRNQRDQTLSIHPKKNTQFSSEHSSPYKLPLTEISHEKDIDAWTRPFQLLIHSKSSHLKHSRSFSAQSPQNKFYSFKKIRQEKCKQQNFGGKVIKSLKFNTENQRPLRKKVIQHLDDVTTIESKNSPRSSLNSLAPEIQQSQIIMKGADLYENLMKENNLAGSKIFGTTKVTDSIFQTPQVRKELGESTYWTNHQNRMNQNHVNCMTDPRLVYYFDEKYPEEENKNIHSFLKYLSPTTAEVEKNKLSFLKVKKADKKY